MSLMIGTERLRPAHSASYAGGSVVTLEARGLCGTVVDNVGLRARRGEVLGIAGLTGSGREEILPLLFGALPRHGAGAVLSVSVRENCVLSDSRRYLAKWGYVDRAAERGEVERWMSELDIRPRRPDAVFGTLSGGNQQKVVLAKWLRRGPEVLLLDEPSQGVDVGAKAIIHALARDVAAGGSCVVIASSDDAELCDTCDRVLVMRDGRIVAEVTAGRLTPEEIGRLQLQPSHPGQER